MLYVFLLGIISNSFIEASFYVCPEPCKAMFLPQDMMDQDDCFCSTSQEEDSDISYVQTSTISRSPIQTLREPLPREHRHLTSSYSCPEHSAAAIRHPQSFEDCLCEEGMTRGLESCIKGFVCDGKYILKDNLVQAASLADCQCIQPYVKEESTGECYLNACPRAGNYIKKQDVDVVHSLADCTCIAPLLKNEQSGQCYSGYQCPARSTRIDNIPAPVDFDDCICDWGFVRDEENALCLPEKQTYQCPPHAVPTDDVPPASFLDCQCVRGYKRVDDVQKCTKEMEIDQDFTIPEEEEFQCPDFSIPLTFFAYSMQQCMCLPGFTPNEEVGECEWDPQAYTCPKHSYNPHPDIFELEFSDCACAKGYIRNEMNLSCDIPSPETPTESPMTTEAFNAEMKYFKDVMKFTCPKGSIIKTWPAKSPADCECVSPECDELPQINDLILENHLYQCPDNMVMTAWPITSLDDCQCKVGYRFDGTNYSINADNIHQHCILETPFQCPNFSTPLSLATVPKSIHDCSCDGGRELSGRDFTCKYPVEQIESSSTETQLIVLNGNEMEYKLVENNIMVTQGDVAVGQSFGFVDDDSHIYILHGYYNQERDHRWKNGTIPFVIESTVAAREKEIQQAMQHITLNTGFHFQKCQEQDCPPDYLVFTPTATGCYSFIGRIGGKQNIGLSNECHYGNIIHELLHAIGLHHPVVRADRDEHIDVIWECIPEQERSFLAIEDSNEPNVPYDFYSIMHPSDLAFTDPQKPWCLSLLPKIADQHHRLKVGEEMGQRDQMSLADIHYVWSLYPQLKTVEQQTQVHTKKKNLHHVSHIHTKAETISTVQTADYFAPIVCTLSLLVFIVLSVYELKLRRNRGKDQTDHELMYSDPLLPDYD